MSNLEIKKPLFPSAALDRSRALQQLTDPETGKEIEKKKKVQSFAVVTELHWIPSGNAV